LQYRADGQKAEWIYTYSHPGFRRVMNSHEKVAKNLLTRETKLASNHFICGR